MKIFRIVASIILLTLSYYTQAALPEGPLPALIHHDGSLRFIDHTLQSFFPRSGGACSLPFPLLSILDEYGYPVPLAELISQRHQYGYPFYFALFSDGYTIHCINTDESLRLPMSYLEAWTLVGYYKLYPSSGPQHAHLTKIYFPIPIMPIVTLPVTISPPPTLQQTVVRKSFLSPTASPFSPSPSNTGESSSVSTPAPHAILSITPSEEPLSTLCTVTPGDISFPSHETIPTCAQTSLSPAAPLPHSSSTHTAPPSKTHIPRQDFFEECLAVFSQLQITPLVAHSVPAKSYNPKQRATYPEMARLKSMSAGLVTRAIQEVTQQLREEEETKVRTHLHQKDYHTALTHLQKLSPTSEFFCFAFIEISQNLPLCQTAHLHALKKAVRKKAKQLFFSSDIASIDKIIVGEYLLDDQTDPDFSHYVRYGIEHSRFECLCIKYLTALEGCPRTDARCHQESQHVCPHREALLFFHAHQEEACLSFRAHEMFVTALATACPQVQSKIPGYPVVLEKQLQAAATHQLFTTEQLAQLQATRKALLTHDDYTFKGITYDEDPLVNFMKAREYWNKFKNSREAYPNPLDIGFARSYLGHCQKQLLAKQKSQPLTESERIALLSTQQELDAAKLLNEEEVTLLTTFLQKTVTDPRELRLQGLVYLCLHYHHLKNADHQAAAHILEEGIKHRSIDCINEKITARLEETRSKDPLFSEEKLHAGHLELLKTLASVSSLSAQDALSLFTKFKDILVIITPHLDKKTHQQFREDPLSTLRKIINKTPHSCLLSLLQELYKNPGNPSEYLTILEYLFIKATQPGKELSKQQKQALARCINYLCRHFQPRFTQLKKEPEAARLKKQYTAQEIFLKKRVQDIQEPATATFSIEEIFSQTTGAFKKT